MTLAAGTRLGPYEIVAPIGAGGMGEVYRARDTRLGRDIALKFLPELFASDPERLARFEREAKTLATLNHPHIAQIHGLEESVGTRALVMELVEGEDLAQRIARGPLPLDEAIAIAKQIADALEAAHEQGIVHRDLKPANIKLRDDGTVKVLDFGLAKDLAAATADVSMSPTFTAPATQLGVILGTAAYMAPEQARGKPIDKRADIWAFGCVLYEMLTGRQAFDGETVTDLLAAVVQREPDWTKLPLESPRPVQRLLRRCLQKDPKQRLRDIGEVRIGIDEALIEPWRAAAVVAEERPSRRWWSPLARLVAASILGAVLGALAVMQLRAPAPISEGAVKRLAVTLPPSTDLGGLIGFPAVAVSPDSSQLAFVGIRDGIRQIYIRPFDGYEAKPIAGTEGATDPFFSRDGQWLGFVANRRMKKLALSGGAPVNLLNISYNLFGVAWGPQNTIVYAPKFDSAIWELPAGGGMPRELTKLDPKQNEVGHHWPEWLPGGNAIVFAVLAQGKSWDEAAIEVQRLDTGERRVLVQGGTYPRYAASGHLLYMRSGALMAIPFDLKRLEVTGSPVTVLDGVMQTVIGSAHFAVSARGDLAYVTGPVQSGEMTLVWTDRQGTSRPLPIAAAPYTLPRLSPDGSRVGVWIIGGARCDVAVYHFARDTWTRLTFAADNHAPVWTPDGSRVVYQSTSGRGYDLFWTRADGGGATEQLTRRAELAVAGSWAPDGRLLAFADFNAQTGWDIWTLQVDGERKPQPFLQTPANELMPALSPDGRWLAYVSDESGRPEVFVRAFPGPGGPWQISTDGGNEPVWARSGKEIFFRHRESIMAVESAAEAAFAPSKPTHLFQGLDEPFDHYWLPNYDVAPDGKQFLMVKTREQAMPVKQINIVLNWTAALRP